MKFIVHLLAPFIFLVSLLFPKKNNMWLFGAWFGDIYADNSKYLFEYVNKNFKEIDAIWIYKNKNIETFNTNCTFIYAYSFKGIFYQLRAKIFVSSVNSNDFIPFFITFKNFYVQLWHGSPIKKIGLDMYEKNSFQYIKNKLRFMSIDNYKLLVSPSKIFDDIFSKAFDINREKIFRMSYPRIDGLLSIDNKDKIRKYFNINTKYLIMYLPTHRNEGKAHNSNTHPVINEILELISYADVLNKNDITILVKPHYYEKEVFSSLRSSENIKFIYDTQEYDIYDCLAVCDGLISDYSSVVFDFELTGKPIMFFPFDIDNYINNDRSMYFDFDFVFSNINNSVKVDTVSELVNSLVNLKEDNYKSSVFNAPFKEDSMATLVNHVIKKVK